MIHRDNGELVAECTDCGEDYNGGTLEWNEFIAELKDVGWQIRKVDDEWEHLCPDCREEE